MALGGVVMLPCRRAAGAVSTATAVGIGVGGRWVTGDGRAGL